MSGYLRNFVIGHRQERTLYQLSLLSSRREQNTETRWCYICVPPCAIRDNLLVGNMYILRAVDVQLHRSCILENPAMVRDEQVYNKMYAILNTLLSY